MRLFHQTTAKRGTFLQVRPVFPVDQIQVEDPEISTQLRPNKIYSEKTCGISFFSMSSYNQEASE